MMGNQERPGVYINFERPVKIEKCPLGIVTGFPRFENLPEKKQEIHIKKWHKQEDE